MDQHLLIRACELELLSSLTEKHMSVFALSPVFKLTVQINISESQWFAKARNIIALCLTFSLMTRDGVHMIL